MDALLPTGSENKDTALVALTNNLEISRTRTIQFLNLMRIPADLRAPLKGMPDLTEARLRPMVQMDPGRMREAARRVAGQAVLSRNR